MRNARKLTLLVVMTAAAMALSASSAMAWTNPGNYVLTNTGGPGANQLTSQVQTTGQPTITCNTLSFPVALGLAPFNAAPWTANQDGGAAAAAGRVTNVCRSSVPVCDPITVTTTGDWTLADNKLNLNNNVQVNFVRFDAVYNTGVGCALNGVTVTVEGNVDAGISYPTTGCAAGQQRTRATFNDADGLDVTNSTGNVIPRGVPVRLGVPSAFVESPCVANTLNPEMTP